MKILLVIIAAVIIYKLFKKLFPGHWILPAGIRYSFFDDLLKQKHLLVAGATGSGKSVVINGLIYHALYEPPEKVQFILIDPKRVELIDYKNLPHTIYYADRITDKENQFLIALNKALDITEKRYIEMQKKHVKKYPGGDLYIIIDEYADLVTTCKKEVEPIIRRLCQIGRAANVHMILATQCTLAKILTTDIRCNFDSIVGLRTVKKSDSRLVIGFPGLETLPKYGQCIYLKEGYPEKWKVDYINDNKLKERVKHWTKQNRKKLLPMIG